jgi:hypothetical protein
MGVASWRAVQLALVSAFQADWGIKREESNKGIWPFWDLRHCGGEKALKGVEKGEKTFNFLEEERQQTWPMKPGDEASLDEAASWRRRGRAAYLRIKKERHDEKGWGSGGTATQGSGRIILY